MILKKEYKLDYSNLGRNLKIRPNEAFNIAQNTATEFFKQWNGDNISVKKMTIYIRYIINALSNDFLDKISIKEIEIHYIAESKEGQNLKIYKKLTDENNIEFLIKESDREIVRANVKFT